RKHRAIRPLFYTIADELGQGDQIRPNDFCHSTHCTVKFAEYLRNLYGTTGALGNEWQVAELTRWDDEIVQNGSPWPQGDLHIHYTTTERAFDSGALAALPAHDGARTGVTPTCGVRLRAHEEEHNEHEKEVG